MTSHQEELMTSHQTLARLSERLLEDVHALYRTLRAAPELSMQEHRTAALIQQRMEDLGYQAVLCGGTGVVAVLRNGAGPVVAFRADIDALPVQEETGLSYASSARGRLPDGTEVPVMHACGHDAHIACAVGAATLLAQQRDDWSGTVVFVFQPGEETSQGARAMVQDGLWDRTPAPQVIFGQHVWPGVAGTVEVSSGPAMAMADSWKVTVHGRGGHRSRPEDTVDPVVLGAHMVVRIQSVVSREVAAQQAAVVTVATFHAGLKENIIIPSTADFTVNVRTLDPDVRARVLTALRLAAEVEASGAPRPVIEELYRFPLLINDPQETEGVVAALQGALGSGNVAQQPPVMGSGMPVYWFFGGLAPGVVHGDAPVPSNHSPGFAPVLESTLRTGLVAAFTAIMSRVGTRPVRPNL